MMARPRLRQALAPLALCLTLAPGCAGKSSGLAAQQQVDLSCPSAKLFACEPGKPSKSLTVTAMAYTDTSASKSKKKPQVKAANGQTLTEDSRAVAISPDLFNMGLDFDKKIRIEGLDGEFTVMDLMSKRHCRCIDIYFGPDHAGARQWGSRTLTISWD